MPLEVNPLLFINFEIPFDRVTAGHVEPAIAELLESAQKAMDALANDPAPRTYENTLLALEKATERLDYAMVVVRHLESVATSPELRAVYNTVQPAVSAFYSSIALNAGIWKQVKAFAGTAEAKQLTGIRKRFLVKSIESFRRHGADLDDAGKTRLAAIDVELTNITTKFSENVLDATNAFERVITDEADLAGLPESALAAARENAKAHNQDGWRFTLHAPSVTPVLTYADKRELREHVWRAYSARGAQAPYDNRALIEQILKLRQEKAELLGFRNFADLVLDDRMAHTGQRALDFLADLESKTRTQFDHENEDLRKFAGVELQPWDIGYYSEKQRLALYDFDEEALRPYFPADQVVAGMFQIVERLYGVQVEERRGVPVWHPDVKFYDICDEKGKRVGSFYADWFPRDTKRGGAWMDGFLTATHGTDETHVGVICGNMTAPLGNDPALLTHREVETIFHEFGHLLHHCLSTVEIKSLSGANVAWDFVELPSQIMENWCWERQALDLFARHYQTDAVIPDDLFQKMRRAKNFRSANNQMRQLGFGITDLKLHTEYALHPEGDVIAWSRAILQRFAAATLPPESAGIASFTHLFSSPVAYAAGYYSYKWAEVLDADAFTQFLEKGIFSRDVGERFRKCILARGDSDDPAQLYREFMGRDPDPEALMRRSGLIAA
jgi:oligopeptidase A